MRNRNTRAVTRLAATPVVLAGLLFAVPATAKAPVIEIGGPGGLPAPSCDGTPANDRGKPKGLGRCSVLTRTTVYPVKDGAALNPTTVPKDSKLVAITLRLGVLKDSKRCIRYKRVKGKRVCAEYDVFNEKSYFDKTFGSGSKVRIAILRDVKKPKGSKAIILKKTVFLGPEIRLEKWFGRTVSLPLNSPITVAKGDVVGLSIPTYAPILPIQATDNGDRWRASRPPSGFKPVDPATGKVVTIDPATKKRPDPCAAKWGVIFVQSAITTSGPTTDFRCRYPGTPTFQFTLIPIPT
ncbi:MAG: hypothetical protein WCO96_02135 [Actinomycetes bacterium]